MSVHVPSSVSQWVLLGIAVLILGVAVPQSVSACSQTMTRGATGDVVTCLQTFLSMTGDYTYPEITGYFGSATEAAVQRFQERRGIVSAGTPFTTGYGSAGPQTRLQLLTDSVSLLRDRLVSITGEGGSLPDRDNPDAPIIEEEEELEVRLPDGREGPPQAVRPSPLDGAEQQHRNPRLYWMPREEADEYAVYIGTSPNLDSSDLAARRDVSFYQILPGDLEYNTTYYWRVDTINRAGTTEGRVWSFTTAGPNATPCDIRPQPQSITAGESTELVWRILNATSKHGDIVISNGVGSQSSGGTGSVRVAPTETTVYRATVRDKSGNTYECTNTLYVSPSSTAQHEPVGAITSISSSGVVSGYAYDPNDSGEPLRVRFYSDGPEGNGRFMGEAEASRGYSGINSNSGFVFNIPDGFRDGDSHDIYAYVYDTTSGISHELARNVRSFDLSVSPTGCSAVRPSDATWINLDFENGELRHDRNPSPYYKVINYREDGDTHWYTMNAGSRYSTWLEPNDASTGCKSLAIELSSDSQQNIQDKAQIGIDSNLTDREQLNVDRDTRRYLAFDIKFDENYEVPRVPFVLHLQAWQCCSDSPPFAIRVEPSSNRNGPIELFFAVRDDANRDDDHVIHRMTVERGEWNNFILQLIPSHNADNRTGQLAFWLNGERQFVYRDDWGYIPETLGGDDNVRDYFQIGLGVYRREQTTTQRIYLDNIRYGGSYATVADSN